MDELRALNELAAATLSGFETIVPNETLSARVLVIAPDGDYAISSNADLGQAIEVLENLLEMLRKEQN